MPRKPDPTSPFKVVIHKDKKYRYAATQPGKVNPDTGKKEYRFVHWGTVDENLRFHPNGRYFLATGEERARLIFPENWDLSETVVHTGLAEAGTMVREGQNESRLYGNSWLLMEIAKITGVYEDLCSVFKDSLHYVDIILTIAFYLILEKGTIRNIEQWPRVQKVPYDVPLKSDFITEFTQKITESNRINMLKCRASRLRPGELCAVDSTSKSAYGKSLADIKYGHNKDHLPLAQTVEVVVYTLDQHGPVYYLTCPGNITDSRSLKYILKELHDAGFKNLVLITDRGYETIENLGMLIEDEQKIITAAKINQRFILDKIKSYGSFGYRPESMKLDKSKKIYYEQFDINYNDINKKSNITSDKLKLNLYLDPILRATKLVELEARKYEQKDSLEAIKSEKIPLGDDKSINENYSFYDIDYDKDKRLVNSFTLKEKEYKKQLSIAGFFANITHKVDFEPATANHHYKLRDEQEKYFNTMKSRLEDNRQRAWSEGGKKGRMFILFIALIIYNYLAYIHRAKLSDKFDTVLDVLNEMKPIKYVEHSNTKAYVTPFIGKQNDICEAFGITAPEGCAPAYATPAQPTAKRGRPRKSQQDA